MYYSTTTIVDKTNYKKYIIYKNFKYLAYTRTYTAVYLTYTDTYVEIPSMTLSSSKQITMKQTIDVIN